jgi:hypothetical protein
VPLLGRGVALLVEDLLNKGDQRAEDRLGAGWGVRKGGGSAWWTIVPIVRKFRPYAEHAWRMLSSPLTTRRRISDHSSLLVSTPASRCQGPERP